MWVPSRFSVPYHGIGPDTYATFLHPFRPQFHFVASFVCSVLRDLAERVIGIMHLLTDLPIPFVCGICVRAFLCPGAAADE